MTTKQKHPCVIPSCSVSLRSNEEQLSFHRVPSAKSRFLIREQWLNIVREVRSDPDWVPDINSYVCSRHFEAKDGSLSGSRRYLDPMAIPTLNLSPASTSPQTNTVQTNVASLIEDANVGSPEQENIDVLGSVEVEGQPDTMVNMLQVACPSCQFFFHVDANVLVTGSEKIDFTSPKQRTPLKSRKRLFYEDDSPSPFKQRKSAASPSTPKGQVTPRSRKRIPLEHNYFTSPRQAADKLKLVKAELMGLKIKYRQLREKLTRRDKSSSTMKEELVSLKALSNSQLSSLEHEYPSLLKTIIKNEDVALGVKGRTGVAYDEEIKKFSATLHFYSPKAYMFLRDHLTLPHPNTISSWMKSSDCGPGFNCDVVQKLSEARKIDTSNVMTDVVIMIDEMSIHKDLIWNPSKHCYVGHINYGVEDSTEDCDAPLAGNALVCLVAGLSGGWKCPIGYIFTEKADSVIQRTFVDRAFYLLEKEDFTVHSLTCDGNSANVAMFESYGVIESPLNNDGSLDLNKMVTSFSNPANPDKSVFAIYDVVHMVKLWRNLLAQCGEITMPDGSKINWKYIEKVQNLQQNERIRAGNKLGLYHIEFGNHKMNVKLAVQALSKSTADTIVFCREDLQLEEFSGSEATSSFIYKLDKVFDILNSRHAAQKGQKAPLTRNNLYLNIHILEEFCEIVIGMKYTEVRNYKKTGKEVRVEKMLIQSMRKRGVIGIVVSIKSIIEISKILLLRSETPFKYVMTYRFSQNLIELLFNKIRGRLGRNNNPNVLEFEQIMKRLWHHNQLKSSNTGNCLQLTEDKSIPGGLLPLKRSNNITPLEDEDIQDLDLDGFSQPKYSEFYTNCLAYIAGNVVRVVGTKLKCETCAEAMLDHELDELDESLKRLIRRKDRGGLFIPCKSVFKVIEMSDSLFRELVSTSSGKMNINNLDKRIAKLVVEKFIGVNLFPHIQSHYIDFDPLDSESHLIGMIKSIVCHFLRIRLFDYGKRYQKFQNISTRHTFTKLTLFKNQ